MLVFWNNNVILRHVCSVLVDAVYYCNLNISVGV